MRVRGRGPGRSAGAFGYNPPTRTASAVAVTLEPETFDPTTGGYAYAVDQLRRLIGEAVVPDDAPPIRR